MDYLIKNILKWLFVIIVMTIPIFTRNHKTDIENNAIFSNSDEILENIKHITQLDDKTLLEVIKMLKIQHPHIVISQARLESGNYKSNIATKNNNLFGMKMPRQRKTTATCKKNGYAYYENWIESVKDYKIWQDKYAKNMTEEEYLSYLSDKYSEDSNYVRKILYFCKKYKK